MATCDGGRHGSAGAGLAFLHSVLAKKNVYNARIVMLGQNMQEGIHFNDTHAPAPSVTCVRLILALTASENRHSQRDVKTAFLNVPIDIELDVLLPEGFGTGKDDDHYSSAMGRRRPAFTAIPGCPRIKSLESEDRCCLN